RLDRAHRRAAAQGRTCAGERSAAGGAPTDQAARATASRARASARKREEAPLRAGPLRTNAGSWIIRVGWGCRSGISGSKNVPNLAPGSCLQLDAPGPPRRVGEPEEQPMGHSFLVTERSTISSFLPLISNNRATRGTRPMARVCSPPRAKAHAPHEP